MSRINDALKKARQAQANAPVRESAPQLRSPAADHPVRTGPSLVLPALIVVVLLLGGGLVWFGLGARSAARDAARNAPVKKTAPAPPPLVDSAPPPAAAITVVPTSPPLVAPPPVATEPVVITPTPAAAPPALPALNGIFFNPAKPTAIVNNKLVSTGSRVGEFTVVAITQTSVTLSRGGQTNVLSLSE